ncbi:MAG: DMT family transporter [Rhodospirillaceae bacterium]|jgi:drug/metabolite transporter (DMT)-like permease|nr:DMT family transporter [Rhodospirillaceae bacterium]MBT6117985.1 DMT family transporter [Rhodospirillaceae bacterium]
MPVRARFDTAQAAWFRLPPNSRGAIWLLCNAVVSTVLIVLVRMVGQDIPTIQLVFIRAAVGVMLILPVVLRMGVTSALRTDHIAMHGVRAMFTFVSMNCFYYAYSVLPLADATAMIFTMPLFLLVLAVAFLGERVGWRRASATLAGFLGVVVMLRPGQAAFDPVLLVALAIGFFDACVAVVVKKLSGTEKPVTIIFYMAAFTLLFASIPAWFAWQPVSLEQLVLILLIAVTTTISQIFTVFAWRVGETTAIAPFNYTQLIFAAGAGFLLFAELPDAYTWTGAAIIIGSTLYIMRREARLKRRGAAIAEDRPSTGPVPPRV